MASEFLPRAHSKKLGELDSSNWKDLESKRNLERVDPAIREIISLLNEKGYTTFSSCSGGHSSKPRRRFDRHESGYIAFSPPSRVAFTLYLVLNRRVKDFGFEAQVVIDDGDGGERETVCTRLYWQLLDQRPAKQQYYMKLFAEMNRIIEHLPRAKGDYKQVLAGLLGKKHLSAASEVVRKQMNRFTRPQ